MEEKKRFFFLEVLIERRKKNNDFILLNRLLSEINETVVHLFKANNHFSEYVCKIEIEKTTTLTTIVRFRHKKKTVNGKECNTRKKNTQLHEGKQLKTKISNNKTTTTTKKTSRMKIMFVEVKFENKFKKT